MKYSVTVNLENIDSPPSEQATKVYQSAIINGISVEEVYKELLAISSELVGIRIRKENALKEEAKKGFWE